MISLRSRKAKWAGAEWVVMKGIQFKHSLFMLSIGLTSSSSMAINSSSSSMTVDFITLKSYSIFHFSSAGVDVHKTHQTPEPMSDWWGTKFYSRRLPGKAISKLSIGVELDVCFVAYRQHFPLLPISFNLLSAESCRGSYLSVSSFEMKFLPRKNFDFVVPRGCLLTHPIADDDDRRKRWKSFMQILFHLDGLNCVSKENAGSCESLESFIHGSCDATLTVKRYRVRERDFRVWLKFREYFLFLLATSCRWQIDELNEF